MATATASSTGTDTATLRLEVVRRGAKSVVRVLRSHPPLAFRPLPAWGATARVALVQSAACLVEGDDVRLSVAVGPGAALEVVELSATLAHPVGEGAVRMHTDVRVAAGGRLVWCEQPLIVAAGTDVVREVRLALAGDARALHGDALVLGREDEQPGRARCRLRITRDGTAVLDETLSLGPGTAWASPAVLGSARSVTGLTLLGVPPGSVALPPDALTLAGGDAALRRVADERRLGSGDLAQVRARWAAAVLSA
ncbi:MAG: urease accessory protein UreD [Actinomycetota bacterium]|nr:urease accessory protein UreD [Actinomycetota bacterium]